MSSERVEEQDMVISSITQMSIASVIALINENDELKENVAWLKACIEELKTRLNEQQKEMERKVADVGQESTTGVGLD